MTIQGGAIEPRQGSGQMFDQIAGRYDLLNRIMSLGIDRGWRNRAIRELEPLVVVDRPLRVLDVATGTGDVAFAVADAYEKADVVGIDPSTGMLAVAGQKLERSRHGERVRFTTGSAEALPFEDGSFDGVTISFGIRNVPDRALGVREMGRVLRPGGRLVILELSEPRGGLFGALAKFHVHHFVPFVGALLSGKKEYRYLQRSIAAFPPADKFAQLIVEQGFDVLSVTPLTFGTAHLYVAERRA
jgi:demethylmenaquinone methyltransferase / 2-methoxy-6-polyprenyl-1,4-benzoquinol methylase